MAHRAPDAPSEPADGPHEALAHVVPVSVLLAVFAALLALTCVTLAATWFDLGVWNLWLAMGIATVKATLVALYFMHLRYDHSFYALVLAVALLFVLLFIGFTLLDTVQYYPDIRGR
jgi:cytochrome c oxidase subunit 4